MGGPAWTTPPRAAAREYNGSFKNLPEEGRRDATGLPRSLCRMALVQRCITEALRPVLLRGSLCLGDPDRRRPRCWRPGVCRSLDLLLRHLSRVPARRPPRRFISRPSFFLRAPKVRGCYLFLGSLNVDFTWADLLCPPSAHGSQPSVDQPFIACPQSPPGFPAADLGSPRYFPLLTVFIPSPFCGKLAVIRLPSTRCVGLTPLVLLPESSLLCLWRVYDGCSRSWIRSRRFEGRSRFPFRVLIAISGVSVVLFADQRCNPPRFWR